MAVPTTQPAIDAGRARAIAERDLGAGASADEPMLGVLAKDDAYVLVYRMIVKGNLDIRRYDVNAITGVNAFSSKSNVPNGGDILTVTSARSLSLALTIDLSRK